MPGIPAPEGSVTDALLAMRGGERSGVDRLFELVYDELRRTARRQLGPGERQTLDTTGLMHEAYLRLVDQTSSPAGSRSRRAA
ncbi:MAG TPA: ECF-type sigma factor [Longimicrobiaceae bacterium]|nr:ECF-type sigma factor [Longimicrobiaceae bacterium]